MIISSLNHGHRLNEIQEEYILLFWEKFEVLCEAVFSIIKKIYIFSIPNLSLDVYNLNKKEGTKL